MTKGALSLIPWSASRPLSPFWTILEALHWGARGVGLSSFSFDRRDYCHWDAFHGPLVPLRQLGGISVRTNVSKWTTRSLALRASDRANDDGSLITRAERFRRDSLRSFGLEALESRFVPVVD